MVGSIMGLLTASLHLKIQPAIAKAKPDGVIVDIEMENVQLGRW